MTDISTATCFVTCWFSVTNRFHVAVRLFSNGDQSLFKSGEGGGGENIFDAKKFPEPNQMPRNSLFFFALLSCIICFVSLCLASVYFRSKPQLVPF